MNKKFASQGGVIVTKNLLTSCLLVDFFVYKMDKVIYGMNFLCIVWSVFMHGKIDLRW